MCYGSGAGITAGKVGGVAIPIIELRSQILVRRRERRLTTLAALSDQLRMPLPEIEAMLLTLLRRGELQVTPTKSFLRPGPRRQSEECPVGDLTSEQRIRKLYGAQDYAA